MEITPFEKLRIYQESLETVKNVYLVVKKFPKEETYALSDQLRRAASSILLNIAESQGRSTTKDKINFLHTSRGSIYEVMAILDLCQSLGFISPVEKENIRGKLFSILKQLNSLITYYKNS